MKDTWPARLERQIKRGIRELAQWANEPEPLPLIIGPITLRTIQEKPPMAVAVVLQDDQQVKLSIAPLDRAGQPARVDGVPSWSSSDAAILTVTPEADGMSAMAVTVGPVGVVQVTVSADADLGAGVQTLSEIATISVVGGQAVSLGMIAGTPEARP